MILIILALIGSVHAQQGSQCYTRENIPGICTFFNQCPKARDDYTRGIYPTLCNQGRNFVCCPPIPIINNLNTNGGRISEQKCTEYSKWTVEKTHVAPLSLGSTSGRQTFLNYKCVHSTPLIVGGSVAKIGEFPHMAALGRYNVLENKYDFICGGTLISENFVLTAAHCKIVQNPATIVRLGDQNLLRKDDGANEIDVEISEFIVHEQYSRKTSKDDIAVIRLKNSIKFTSNIRPACLWQNFQILSDKTVATGFGKQGYYDGTSEELLKVQLHIFDNSKCEDANVDSTQICAGGEFQGNTNQMKDTCQGDSGGPIQIHYGSNKCVHYVIGITSFGNPYCAGAPSVYTRVSSYIDWIERKVWG